MQNMMKKLVTISLFLVLTAEMLFDSASSLDFALTGLNLWFQKMIPTLLPFMILSGILIRIGLSDTFALFFAPVLAPLYKVSSSCIYCMVIGFLCGFPMGARVIAESLERERITKEEASFLLAFCNNIGPVYFIGFVLAGFQIRNPWPFLAGMYLIPMLYGLFLRYTSFRTSIHFSRDLPAEAGKTLPSLLECIDEAITAGLTGITRLGGYMILFNMLNLLPMRLLSGAPSIVAAMVNCMLEITSGISRMTGFSPFWVFVILPFGGFSCIAQTYSMISYTELSIRQYVYHKIVQTGITFVYCWILLQTGVLV